MARARHRRADFVSGRCRLADVGRVDPSPVSSTEARGSSAEIDLEAGMAEFARAHAGV